jgi:hypothetical protein
MTGNWAGNWRRHRRTVADFGAWSKRGVPVSLLSLFLLGAATDNISHANRLYLYNLHGVAHYQSIDKVKNWNGLTDTDSLAYVKGG